MIIVSTPESALGALIAAAIWAFILGFVIPVFTTAWRDLDEMLWWLRWHSKKQIALHICMTEEIRISKDVAIMRALYPKKPRTNIWI